MGFTVETGISVATVFIQGALSFFSPCVLPLVPLYISYLAGGAGVVDENGVRRYPRLKVLINTLFFVFGIGFAFFLLGLGMNALGSFFREQQLLISRISGVLILLFGMYQLGVGNRADFLEREHRLPFRVTSQVMNPLIAWAFGFTFSFAWTPCVGPALSSVLLMAASSESATEGFVLIGVYTLGFVLPFLAVGLFTGTVLGLFKKHQNVVRYTVKTGAVLLIIMGVMTLSGTMKGVSSVLAGEISPEELGQSQEEIVLPPAPDFTLKDQYGKTHTLSDYQGKTVFLNFWGTWCGPCRAELPHVQSLYEDYGDNSGDLIVLGVAWPNAGQEGSEEEITAFLEENGCTYPVLMDLDGEAFYPYGITAFPTTFMINTEGNAFGYISGSLTREMMESIVQQTMSGIRE